LVRLGQAEGRAITLRRPAEPAGQVPVARAEQLHRGGQQDGTDDRRVEQHGHRQADAHLLELDHGQGREGEEMKTMTAAAAVTTPAVVLMPTVTAWSVWPVRS